MVESGGSKLFESDEYGRQRSIIFAIVVATGFLAVLAGAFTVVSSSNVLVGAGLLLVGVLVLAVGVGVAMGKADDFLFE